MGGGDSDETLGRESGEPRARPEKALPDGVVTFVLTDIEGSTEAWDANPADMSKALARHETVVEDAVEAHHGRLLKSRGEGDATLSVFRKATDALSAAVSLQRWLNKESWPGALVIRTRVAVHTGEAQLRAGDYYGGTLNRAARIRGLAAGGEIFVSRATHDLVADVLPADVELVSLGEHTLKGLRRDELVFAVRAPGLDDPSSTDAMHNVPVARTTLVGRVDVLAQLERELSTPGLVTIAGPGGIGKTRVLREACGRFGRQFFRTWTVDLVGARHAADVEGALQTALAPTLQSTTQAQPGPDEQSIAAEITSRFGGRRTLLAIDNCEHVLDCVRDVVAALLAEARTLSILTTSREPLDLSGERLLRLGPLQLPDAEAGRSSERLAHVESIQLLVNHVRAAGGQLPLTVANSDAVCEICRQLDGVPLAIELAAARLRATSPQELAGRLSRQLVLLASHREDARHRTLHSTIDWSYQLLDPAQQTLLRRLGIFVGGFTLAAAEEVCANDVLSAADAVYLGLAELVAKSLVVFDGDRSRYRLLEPIRLFARDLLTRSDEHTDVADRHAHWASRRSRDTLIAVMLGDGPAIERLRDDLDNVHAALDWLREHAPHSFLRMVATLGYTWYLTDWRRGRATAQLAVELADSASDNLRAAVLLSRGIVEQRHDVAGAGIWLDEARTLYLSVDDPAGAAWATYYLACSRRACAEEDAERLFLEALDRFHILDLAVGEAWALVNLADQAQDYGRVELALGYAERGLALATSTKQTWVVATLHDVLARGALSRGDLDTARRELRIAMGSTDDGDAFNLGGLFATAAVIEIVAGKPDTAEPFVYHALRFGLKIDNEWHLREGLLLLALVRALQRDFATARSLFAATRWDVDDPDRFFNPGQSATSASHEFTDGNRLITVVVPRIRACLAASSPDESAEERGRAIGVYESARQALQPAPVS